MMYPISSRIIVLRDDDQWDSVEKWCMRPQHIIDGLYVVTYNLRTDDDGEVDLTYREWCEFSEKMVNDHPGCIFCY
jgi:hypothetical protein